MAIFHEVAERGSFSAAARELGIAKSAVSNQVRRLETDLGVQLLHRSTRKLALTEAGAELLESARRIVAEADTARRRLAVLRERPVGTLRVGTSIGFGMLHLIPALAAFHQEVPELAYDVVLEDRKLDLIGDKLDFAVAFGAQSDSAHLVETLGKMGWCVCATPGYLASFGVPEAPADLASHRWLEFSGVPPRDWTFSRGGQQQRVRPRPTFSCNNLLGVHAALRAGMGVSAIARGDFAADLEAGVVTPLLESWELPPLPVVALKSRASRDLPKIRLVVDFLRQRWSGLV